MFQLMISVSRLSRVLVLKIFYLSYNSDIFYNLHNRLRMKKNVYKTLKFYLQQNGILYVIKQIAVLKGSFSRARQFIRAKKGLSVLATLVDNPFYPCSASTRIIIY